MSQTDPNDAVEEDRREENELLDAQGGSEDEDMPFDFYIPFAVLLGEKRWDQLTPLESTPEKESESAPILLPASRVKKVMKMDPDVNIISKQALNLMTKATTLFIDFLASKTEEWMSMDSGKQNSTLIQVCRRHPSLQFLLDDLSLEEMASKRVRTSHPEMEETQESDKPSASKGSKGSKGSTQEAAKSSNNAGSITRFFKQTLFLVWFQQTLFFSIHSYHHEAR